MNSPEVLEMNVSVLAFNYFVASLWTGRLRQNVGLVLVLTMIGCSDGLDKSISTLTGTWNFELVSSGTDDPSDKKQINFYLEKGLLKTNLKTDCGMDGLFGGWIGDWSEVEVEGDRAPEGSVSGAVTFKCITNTFPVSGYLISPLPVKSCAKRTRIMRAVR